MSAENGLTSADTDVVKIGVIQILPGFGLFIICGFIHIRTGNEEN
jgi:hypothetical protein